MGPARPLAEALRAAVAEGGAGLESADRLCVACTDLLGVDGASIAVVHRGQSRGTYGSSGELSRRLDAFHFTFGEGPCLDAVATAAPVLAPDLVHDGEQRWPAFTAALAQTGVRAVFALPVLLEGAPVAALDLFRRTPGPLTGERLDGALVAASLAAGPLHDLADRAAERAAAGVDEAEQDTPWEELRTLDRTEIYQANGFLIAQAELSPADALVSLRARAYATGRAASEVAQDVLARRLHLDPGGTWHRTPSGGHHGGDHHGRRGGAGRSDGPSGPADEQEER